MERVLRQFSFLDSHTFGDICKMAFAFVDGVTLTDPIPDTTKMYFTTFVRPKLEAMLGDRERAKRGREKAKKK